MDLFFDNEFRSLIPPLQPDEKQHLTDSLIHDGNRDPIVVWKETKLLLDGHNRYDICTANNIPLKPAIEISLPSRDDAKIWIIRNQFSRRNLSSYSRSVLALKLEELIAAKAKEIQTKPDFHGNQYTGAILENSPKDHINTRVEVAKIARVSDNTIAKVKTIEIKANVEQKAKLVSGDASINEIFNTVTNKAHVGNATGENEWYTPSIYIEAARSVMGTIDIDPASTEAANKIIKAKRYFTIQDDGRTHQWIGNVWMNPPYSQPLVADFCNLLVEKIKTGETKSACVLVNNATETNFFQAMLAVCNALCFIKGRIKFIDTMGVESGAPLQGQALFYFGDNLELFKSLFRPFGVILYAERQG